MDMLDTFLDSDRPWDEFRVPSTPSFQLPSAPAFKPPGPRPPSFKPKKGRSRATDYDDMIFAASERHGVDPAYIKAKIRTESNFNPNAVSAVGAKGLMQIMDSTGKDLGITDPFDPDQSIDKGTEYFAGLFKKYDGDTRKASAAYNAGSRNIDKAVNRYGDKWLENLHKVTGTNKKTGKPHAEETRKYVKKISKYYDEYKKAAPGKRADGTEKGKGFLGELPTSDGKGYSTEISIGVKLDGKETEIPLLVPTLDQAEIEYLLSGNKPSEEITQKAVDHAKTRMSKGLSPFAQDGEQAPGGQADPFDAFLDSDSPWSEFRQGGESFSSELGIPVGDIKEEGTEGKYDFFNKLREMTDEPSDVLDYIPFVAGAKEVSEVATVAASAYKLDQGTATQEDQDRLVEFLKEMNKDTTFGYKVLDTVSKMPAFMGEFLLTSGIYTAGKKVGTKAATSMIKKFLGKSGEKLLKKKIGKLGVKIAGGVVGGTVQTPIMGLPRIISGTIERSMPKLNLTEDERGELSAMISGEGEDLMPAMLKSFGDQWAETISEHSGGMFAELGTMAKNVAIKSGLLSAFLKANPAKTPGNAVKLFKKMGYHGVINEMAEERLGEVLRAATGVTEEYSLPTSEQLAVELVSFSVPGVVQAVSSHITSDKEDDTKIPPPGAAAIPEEGAAPSSPSIDKIRAKFDRGEHTAEDLEAIKEIWSDDAELSSSIDELLKSKPAEPVEPTGAAYEAQKKRQAELSKEFAKYEKEIADAEQEKADDARFKEIRLSHEQKQKVIEDEFKNEIAAEKQAEKVETEVSGLKAREIERAKEAEARKGQVTPQGQFDSMLTPAEIKQIEDQGFDDWRKKAGNKKYTDPFLDALAGGMEDRAFELWDKRARKPGEAPPVEPKAKPAEEAAIAKPEKIEGAQPEAPVDRRKTEDRRKPGRKDTERRKTERRDVVTRKALDELSPEEQGFVIPELRRMLGVQKKAALRQERIADSDPLTGLKNRRGLKKETVRREKEGKESYHTFIDLIGFKGLNDFISHEAGDETLMFIAKAMKSVGLENPTRWGGDELMFQADSSGAGDTDAQKLHDYFEKNPLRLKDKEGKEYDLTIMFRHGTAKSIEKADEIAEAAKETEPPEWKRGKAHPGLKEVSEAVEGEGTIHDYSSTQINLPKESAKSIKEFGRKIPDKELYTEPDDDSYGREEAPHITVRYGLETSKPEDVAPAFEGIGPIKVKFGKVSIFESDDYDVIKVDVESPDLVEANKKVGETVKLPGETFKDYKPHATIAYVKKGEGKKYVGDKSLEGQKAIIDSIFLSAKDGKMHEIKLKPTPVPEKTDVALEGEGVEKVEGVAEIPTEALSLDPDRFQYKRFLAKDGISSKLKDIKKYDPELGGIISVWKDPEDGKVYVVNGHHRYELAKRTGEKFLTVRYLQAETAKEAKTRGALINIAENQGTPEDAAVIFRKEKMTADELKAKYHISLKGDIVKKGMGLSRLHPELFRDVERQELPQSWGVAIGEGLEDHDAQIELVKFINTEIRKGRNINVGIVEQIINDIIGGTVGKAKEEQISLFGKKVAERPLLIERAELRDCAIKKLASDKRLFGTVSKEEKAKRLTLLAKNVIDIKESRAIADEADTIRKVFETLAASKGEISDALNEFAKELSNAKGPERNRIKGDFLERLREIIPRLIKGTKRGGAEGSWADAERRLDQSFAQVKESLDLFGKKKPGQIELWSMPKPEREKKTRAKRKVKPPPREAQLDLFTGKQDQPIQTRLFQDFIRGGKKAVEKAPGEVQKPEADTVEGVGQWTRTSPTGRIFEAPSLVAKTAGEIASLLSSIGQQARESLYTVTVDKNDNILEVFEHSRGTKTGSLAHPVEIAGHILNIPKADKAYFVHNHPSGDTFASNEDTTTAESLGNILSLKNIEIESFVIGKDKWRPVQYLSVPDEKIKPVTGKERVEVVESILTEGEPGRTVQNSDDFRKILKDKYGGKEGILFFDTKLRELGFMPWPAGESIKKASAQIIAASESVNASGYAIALNKPITYKNRAEFIRNFATNLNRYNLQLFEVLEQGKSYADTGILRTLTRHPTRKFDRLLSEEPLYSTIKTEAKTTADKVFKTILPYLQGMTNFPTVRVVHSDNLSKRLKSQITAYSKKVNKQVEGFYDKVTDTVYLLYNNLSEGRIEAVLRHEAEGHRGIRLLLGSDLDGFLDGVAKAKKNDLLTHDPGLNFKDRAAVRVAADEWIARKIEAGNLGKSFWDDLVRIFRKWLRKIAPNLDLTDSEIRSVLVDTVRNVREGRIDRIKEGEGMPLFSTTQGLTEKQRVFLERHYPEKLEAFEKKFKRKNGGTISKESKKGLKDSTTMGETPSSPEGFNMPHEGKGRQVFDLLQFKIQDRLNSLRKVQKTIEKQKAAEIPDDTNAYQVEELYHGKVGRRVGEFDVDHLDPLVDSIHESGLDLEDVEDFLYARHAPEANKRLQDINPKREDNEALSGMSNEEAEAVMAKHVDNKAMLDIVSQVDAITKKTRQILVDEGLATSEEIAAWENAYKYYVPLKREGKALVAGMPKKGTGMDIKGAESKKRMTGSAELKAVNILANIVAQHEAAIIRAEKAKVGRAMLTLAETNPSKELWQVDAPELKPFLKQRKTDEIDETTGLPVTLSEVVFGKDILYKFNDNVLVVKVGGEERTITFNDKNVHAQRIVRSLKNLGADNSNAVINTLATVNRFLAIVNTSANPEFILSNFTRDIQTAGYNINDTEAKNIKARIFKDVFKALQGIRKGVREDYGSEWAKNYRDFAKAGAQTGWTDHYKNIEDREKSLRKKLDLLKDGKWGSVQRTAKGLFEFVSNENTAVENAIRLSTYTHLKRIGLSNAKAASAAKNLTVNFNRRGDMGQALNALYLFFNANVQGSARLIYAAVRSPTVRRMMYGTVAFAVMLDILNRAIGGEDDDGEKRYDKVPSWVKEHNMILMRSNGDYFKLPLPWGYNTLHVLGQSIGEAVDPNKDEFDAMAAAGRLGSAVVGSFNPLGSESTILQLAAPTIADPFVQWRENQNFAGIPIKPEQLPFDVPKPEYQMYWQNSRRPIRWVTKKFNDLTGGDEVKPGLVNVSPEVIDLFVDTLAGGAGKFIDNTISLPGTLTKKDVEVRKIPFIRKVYGESPDYYLRTKFYDNSGEIKYAEKSMKHYEDDKEMTASTKRKYAWELRFVNRMRRDKAAIRSLRKKRRILENQKGLSERDREKKIEETEKKVTEIMTNFNRTYKGRKGQKRVVLPSTPRPAMSATQKPLTLRQAMRLK